MQYNMSNIKTKPDNSNCHKTKTKTIIKGCFGKNGGTDGAEKCNQQHPENNCSGANGFVLHGCSLNVNPRLMHRRFKSLILNIRISVRDLH